jgi:cystathionine gamma-synthase
VIDALTRLFHPGDHVLLSDGLCGGTYRMFEQLLRDVGIDASYVDTSNLSTVESHVRPNTVVLFIETPSNPTWNDIV